MLLLFKSPFDAVEATVISGVDLCDRFANVWSDVTAAVIDCTVVLDSGDKGVYTLLFGVPDNVLFCKFNVLVVDEGKSVACLLTGDRDGNVGVVFEDVVD